MTDISEELKTALIQTMFRARSMQGFFHGGQGHNHRCEHKHEWAHERRGMSPHEFRSLFEFEGRQSSLATPFYILRSIELNTMKAADAADAASSSETSFAAELQRHLHVSKAAISQNLAALEKRGLIERTINPRDLRRFNFTLTEKGKLVAGHLRRHMDENLDEVLERMGEADSRELIRLFNRFFDIIEDMTAARRAWPSEGQGSTAGEEQSLTAGARSASSASSTFGTTPTTGKEPLDA